jgi:hypothetical protein
LLLAGTPFAMIMAYVVYAPVILLYTPDHWCVPDPNEGNSSTHHDIERMRQDGIDPQCYMYSEKQQGRHLLRLRLAVYLPCVEPRALLWMRWQVCLPQKELPCVSHANHRHLIAQFDAWFNARSLNWFTVQYVALYKL